MGKKGNFGAGLILGIAAGVAAKYLVDNKENVKEVVSQTTVKFKDGVTDFADYAGEKLTSVGEEVTKAANEYIDYAKGQFNEIKNTLTSDFCGYTDEEAQADECCCGEEPKEAECPEVDKEEE